MEKEQNQNLDKNKSEESSSFTKKSDDESKNQEQKQVEKKNPEEVISELEDKLARTFAEMENQRRRFEKEKDEAFEYGGFVFAKEALSLIDNLERSKQILKNDEKLKESKALAITLDHLEVINKDLISIFSKNKIKQIECLNKNFDPNFHQAMMEIEDNNKEPGTIVQEIQKGFTIGDRLLRPSLVAVSKKFKNTDKKDEENEEILEKK